MELEPAVSLVPSQYDAWERRFATMASRLEALVPGASIEHIGSTAVPGLPAKDVVDVLIGVAAPDVVRTAQLLVAAGFDLEGQRSHHCWLSSPDRRHRAYVLHVVEHAGRAWTRRIDFRELLRRDGAAREVYLQAKQTAARSTRGWDDYTQAKSGVVAELLAGNVRLGLTSPDNR